MKTWAGFICNISNKDADKSINFVRDYSEVYMYCKVHIAIGLLLCLKTIVLSHISIDRFRCAVFDFQENEPNHPIHSGVTLAFMEFHWCLLAARILVFAHKKTA